MYFDADAAAFIRHHATFRHAGSLLFFSALCAEIDMSRHLFTLDTFNDWDALVFFTLSATDVDIRFSSLFSRRQGARLSRYCAHRHTPHFPSFPFRASRRHRRFKAVSRFCRFYYRATITRRRRSATYFPHIAIFGLIFDIEELWSSLGFSLPCCVTYT